MKVLLLGATGLLGHNVLHQLSTAGHEVVAVVRRRHSLRIQPPGLHLVEGDITRRDTVVSAAEGCDAIVNCAGVTDMSLLHYEDYTSVNVDLCQTLISAMNTHGIRCLVHASTANTIGYGSKEHPTDEQAPIKAPFDRSYYAESKLHGEQILRDAAVRNPDWHIVIVNPGFMIGPMDVKPSSGRMLLAGYRKPLMFAPRGGKAFVDVRDVATAMVNALTQGRHGARYIAVSSRGCLTINELYQLQASTMGYRQHVVTLPDWLLAAAGFVGDGLRAVGLRTELSTRNVRQLMVREWYDNRSARTELAMPESDIAHAISDFHNWRRQA
jgi:nucleoside-diphosphate-sugar epimerase